MSALVRAWLIAGLVTLAAAGLPVAALADGDPASDVLLTENVFVPFSPQVSAPLARALAAAVSRAHAAGYPLKVALIESPGDLGADPELFGTPARYARFLDTEITYNDAPPLLVVMPQGVGTAHTAGAGTLTGIVIDTSARSDGLARAAIRAVITLAARSGHPITPPLLPGSASAGAPVGAIAGGVVAGLLGLALAGTWLVRRRRPQRTG